MLSSHFSCTSAQGRHCPTLAGMARMETPVSFAHLINILAIFPCFCPYVTGFCPLCPLFLKYLNPRYGNCHTCHTGVAAPDNEKQINIKIMRNNVVILYFSTLVERASKHNLPPHRTNYVIVV